MSDESLTGIIDYKEKYYLALEKQLTSTQTQLLLFQKELAFKERQNRRLSDKIKKLTVGRELSDLTPEKDLDFAAFEEAQQGLETLLQPSMTPSAAIGEMFKVWPAGSITETFDLTTSGKPRKRARKKCRDCHKDDCKGATSGPFGKLLCPEWVANNPEKAAEYQEKLKEMKK